jgi:hypothetical protein
MSEFRYPIRKRKLDYLFTILDIWMSQDELPKGGVKSETIDSVSSAQHELP